MDPEMGVEMLRILRARSRAAGRLPITLKGLNFYNTGSLSGESTPSRMILWVASLTLKGLNFSNTGSQPSERNDPLRRKDEGLRCAFTLQESNLARYKKKESLPGLPFSFKPTLL